MPTFTRPVTALFSMFVLCALTLSLALGLRMSPSDPPAESAGRVVIDNPYADVNWGRVEYIHSMSHQHGGLDRAARREFYEMGYRHFAFSNYYPSKPTYPLEVENASVTAAPNAEHHSFTDSGVHVTALGSTYETGYGRRVDVPADAQSPLTTTFDDVHRYDPQEEPWRGIYRFDVSASRAGSTEGLVRVRVKIDGAVLANRTTHAVTREMIDTTYVCDASSGCDGHMSRSLYLRTTSDAVSATIEFDEATTDVTRYRLMQGVNRPWQPAFAEALASLMYEDGGGLIINHPRQDTTGQYEQMLDFDDRVLGVEVWNDRRWFGMNDEAPHRRYYDHWDALLRTGRRSYGFFVKDHRQYGRGRNVLLVPDTSGMTRPERERALLQAYRDGRFFGQLGASSVDEDGRIVPPYDRTAFRFNGIDVRTTNDGIPTGIDVAVTGHDTAVRPNVQVRFVTDAGVAHVVAADDGTASFDLPTDASGRVVSRYVRVEAFAYPDTHDGGVPLRFVDVAALNVYEVARLHDFKGHVHPNRADERGHEPIPVVDMIFSQPIRIVYRK